MVASCTDIRKRLESGSGVTVIQSQGGQPRTHGHAWHCMGVTWSGTGGIATGIPVASVDLTYNMSLPLVQ